MDFANSGFQRATEVIVHNYNKGVLTDETPYSLLPAFSYSGVNYPVLTSDQLMKLSVSDYMARATALFNKLSSDYDELQIVLTDCRVYNPSVCPI
jgi:hypothetical protein